MSRRWEWVKNGLLTLLVVLSLFLSWRLWTYQPEYDYLAPAHFAAHEGLAQQKELHELYQPHLIIHHLAEEEHTLSYPKTHPYITVQNELREWSLEPVTLLSREHYEEWQELYLKERGLELYFREALPLHLLGHLFQVEADDWLQELKLEEEPRVERLWFYHDPEQESGVSLLLFSEANQLMLKSSVKEGKRAELDRLITMGQLSPKYRRYVVQETGASLYSIYYLSQQSIPVLAKEYTYEQIPASRMLAHLFIDPRLVRRIEERGGSILYIHGARAMRVNQAETAITYFHPRLEQERSGASPGLVDLGRGIQFVNQHSGWDRPYLLDSIVSSPLTEEVQQLTFREYVDYYPVYGSGGGETLQTIKLELQEERVVGYSRPLLLRGELSWQRHLFLPPGEELLGAMEEAGVDPDSVKSITIGYKAELEEEKISYRPCWVIQFRQGERWFIRKAEEIRGQIK